MIDRRHGTRHAVSLARGLRGAALRGAPLLAAIAISLVFVGGGSASTPAQPVAHRDHGRGHWFKRACAVPTAGQAACNAQVVTNANGAPLASNAPAASALGPAQFAGAYALPETATSNATIAIVDAYDNPNIEKDLGSFSSYYGLPACTTANGCFRKVGQNGTPVFPQPNLSWGVEIALDVETAHEICQACKILLVEASSPSFANLGAAENTAARLGASVISNSWGGAESKTESSYDSLYFNHPGIVITASAGDSGYGAQYPAASPYVVAVGGTTLKLTPSNGYQSETVWSDTGSGCSAYESKPAAQVGVGCANRTISDVSADADPNTGAAIFDSYGYGGWVQTGGTSLSAPLIAAVYALSGNTSNGAAPYANRAGLHDVTSGSNGSCSPASLCTAGVGYDGPTGLGTPNGLAAFNGSTVTPPAADFSLAVSPASQSVTQGQTAAYTVTLTPNGSFSGSQSVTLSAASSPSDLGLSGCNSPLTVASPTCILSASTAGAATTSHTLDVTGAGSAGLPTHDATATLAVQVALAPDYSLAVSPASQNAVQGQTATYTVTLTPNAAFTSGQSVAVTADSAPADVTTSGCASALTAAAPSCTLSFGTTTATATSSHAITVSGVGSAGAPSHTAGATLVVQAALAPDFSLAVSPPSQTAVVGQSVSYTVTLTPNAAFSGSSSVTVGAASAPADVATSGCSTPLTATSPSCTLMVATTGASLVSHALTVTGTGSAGLPAHTAGATLVLQAASVGDFALSLSPSSRFVVTPSSPTFAIVVSRLGGFTGSITYTVSGLPAGFTYSVSPNPSAGTATLTIVAPKSNHSVFTFTLTGTSGTVSHSTTGSMTVV